MSKTDSPVKWAEKNAVYGKGIGNIARSYQRNVWALESAQKLLRHPSVRNPKDMGAYLIRIEIEIALRFASAEDQP